MKNPNIEISNCFKTLSIQAAKENSRIIQQRNATESDTSTLIHHHDTAHLESLNVLWLPRNCSMLLTGTTVVISTFKRWSSISTQSAGTTWTRGKSERYFPKLMSRETEPSTSGSLKFVSWAEHLYPNWHSDLQSVMNRIKNAGWKKVQRKRNKNGSISTRISDLRCQSILYLLLPHPNYKSCQWIFAKYNIWRRLLLGASHFRVSLYGRLFSGPSGSLPAFTEYCKNFVIFYLQLYKLPGICRRVFDLCDKDSNGTLSFRVTSTCYVNYAITSQPHCLQLVM